MKNSKEKTKNSYGKDNKKRGKSKQLGNSNKRPLEDVEGDEPDDSDETLNPSPVIITKKPNLSKAEYDSICPPVGNPNFQRATS